MLKKWWPEFTKKYKKKFPIMKLSEHIKRKFFCEPVNMTLDEYKLIPGLFRYRVAINSNNLNKPHKSYNKYKKNKNLYQMPNTTNYNTEIMHVIEESKRDYENKCETELKLAMKKSIGELKSENMDDINKQLIDYTIKESLSEQNSNQNSEQSEIDFYVIIDLRVYGPNPEKPIYIETVPFYLNERQIKIVKNLWNKINNIDKSNNFFQNVEYIKSSYKDFARKAFENLEK